MRSIFLYLRDTSESIVAQFLQSKFPVQKDPPWILSENGDPCLYIDFYRDARSEFEPENWSKLVRDLGCEPTVCVAADISGRHSGDVQVLSFIDLMLQEFRGVVQDDYTSHSWSAAEISSGHKVEGHPFFDYNGWFKETKSIRDRNSIEIFVKDCSIEKLAPWLASIVGPLGDPDDSGEAITYTYKDGVIVLTPNIENSAFTSLWFNTKSALWSTPTDCAHTAAANLNCVVRCEPSLEQSGLPTWVADAFLEIFDGVEKIVKWA